MSNFVSVGSAHVAYRVLGMGAGGSSGERHRRAETGIGAISSSGWPGADLRAKSPKRVNLYNRTATVLSLAASLICLFVRSARPNAKRLHRTK